MWFASQYLDNGQWGIIDNENRIIVGVSARLSETDAKLIASEHGATERIAALEEQKEELLAALRKIRAVANPYLGMGETKALGQLTAIKWEADAAIREHRARNQSPRAETPVRHETDEPRNE